MDFAENLKYLRHAHQFTQKELAYRLGLSANCICEWEKGRSEPSLETIRKLAELFEVSTDYLLGLEDDFGAKVAAPMSSPAPSAAALDADDKKLLDVYHTLDDDMKATLWSLLGTWTPTTTLGASKKQGTK